MILLGRTPHPTLSSKERAFYPLSSKERGLGTG
jgi:hypothetical protein